MFVPSDREIPRAVNEGVPIVIAKPQSEAAEAFRQLAALYVAARRRRARARRRAGRSSPLAAAACSGGGARWNSTSDSPRPGQPSPQGTREPFAELKTQIHLAVIGELGPQLFNVSMDPARCASAWSSTSGGTCSARRRSRATTASASRRRSPTTSSATARSSGSSPTTRSRRSWSTAPSEIWIERQGRLYETTVRFNDDSHLRRIINKMVGQVGRRVDESSPMVDARLPDGSRVNVIIPPLSLSGPLVTIRKFSKKRLTLDDMVNLGTLVRGVGRVPRAVRRRASSTSSSRGGTGTGKTTLLNALSSAIPESERIVTIEDAAELQLHQRHVLRLEARPKNIEGEGEIAIRELVRNSLRMRPDRIIVGEVRGAEALDMLQAMNTGHDGSLSTVHANSPRDALHRIETMVLMAGLDLPVRAIRQQVSSALDLIVHLERLEDGSRRVTHITEVQRMESDVITLQDLFEFKIESIAPDRTITGDLAADRAAAAASGEVREARHRAAAATSSRAARVGAAPRGRSPGRPVRRAAVAPRRPRRGGGGRGRHGDGGARTGAAAPPSPRRRARPSPRQAYVLSLPRSRR